MKDYNNRVVFITGAAHGIGLSLAKIYYRLGAKIVAVDINQVAINQAKELLPKASFYNCDITKKEQVYALAKTIIDEIGVPDILVNNAGVVENSSFLNCSDELLERTMNVNIMAHFWMVKAFLPAMIERGEGNLCQVASAAGLMGVRGLVAYCSSKHAVVGFSNALRLELDETTKGKIKLTVVCPSFINTGMFNGVKPARFTPLLDQEKIAQIIFKAVDRDKCFVLEPFMVKIVPFLQAIFPTKMFNLIGAIFKVNNAMDNINKA